MAAGDLTTLVAVKTWLAGSKPGGNLDPAGGGSSDPLLTDLISAASVFVGQYTQRNILSASYTEVQTGNGKDFMLLRNGPVTAVTSIGWPGISITTVGDPIALTAGYLIDGTRKLRLIGYCFPARSYLIQITYTAGYSAVPLDLQQAVNELVGEAFKRRDRIGITSKNMQGGVGELTSFSTADMNATIKGVLDRYRFLAPV